MVSLNAQAEGLVCWPVGVLTVQVRCLHGEQGDQLVAPAADGGLGHVVAIGHVGQALVVPQHGQDDHRDPPGWQDPPP
ncbi:hypothetical protein [Streptomyces olivaceoviridis]